MFPLEFFGRFSGNTKVFRSLTKTLPYQHVIFKMVSRKFLETVIDQCSAIMAAWATNRDISDTKHAMKDFVHTDLWGEMTTHPTLVDERGLRAAATVEAGAVWGASSDPPMTTRAMIDTHGEPILTLLDVYTSNGRAHRAHESIDAFITPMVAGNDHGYESTAGDHPRTLQAQSRRHSAGNFGLGSTLGWYSHDDRRGAPLAGSASHRLDFVDGNN